MSEQISSRFMFITKWLFPMFWFGFLILFIAQSVIHEGGESDVLFLAGPAFMAVIGFLFFRALVWDLADVVYDQGAHLLVRRGSVEDRISFENIMNVSSTPLMSPPRITLRLVKPSAFGTHVSFSPKSGPLGFSRFEKIPIAEQLMERAYLARGKRAG